MILREITSWDRELVERLRDTASCPLTAYAFPALYLWRSALGLTVAVSKDSDLLAVHSDVLGGWFYPCGSETACDAFLRELRDEAAGNGKPLRLLYLSRQQAQHLAGMGFLCTLDRNDSEYIYDAAVLADPTGRSGKNLHRKLQAFRAETDYTVRPLSSADALLLHKITVSWGQTHNEISDQAITFDAIDHLRSLNLQGILLEAPAGGAFILGYENTPELYTFTIVRYAEGLSANAVAACIHEFAKLIAPRYPKIDLEEDMGLSGLRQMKTAYHPAFLLEAYTAEFSGEEPV